MKSIQTEARGFARLPTCREILNEASAPVLKTVRSASSAADNADASERRVRQDKIWNQRVRIGVNSVIPRSACRS